MDKDKRNKHEVDRADMGGAGSSAGETPALRVIARVHSDFPEKFGIPRQSGLVGSLTATVVFEPQFRNPDALRGLAGFSHIWLLWGFSANMHAERSLAADASAPGSPAAKTGAAPDSWSPTVRPPRLGGNKRMGVFATRSPFRPNPIGLSCVRLTSIETDDKLGSVLHISGADLMDGTPIYDIKPYLPFTDSHPDATSGFAGETAACRLTVDMPKPLLARIPESKREALLELLAQDPRPSYQNDPERRYGLLFAGFHIHFTVENGILTVLDAAACAKADRQSQE